MHKFFILACGAFLFLPTSSYSEEFPLSSRNYQATVVHIENVNGSNALAVGEVMIHDAEEYCNRDPGGITKRYGGKLTFQECVKDVLEEEKGKKVSATADCLRKTVTVASGGVYTMVDSRHHDDSYIEYIWKEELTGVVLDGSNASGAPIVEKTFEMLCPAFLR